MKHNLFDMAEGQPIVIVPKFKRIFIYTKSGVLNCELNYAPEEDGSLEKTHDAARVFATSVTVGSEIIQYMGYNIELRMFRGTNGAFIYNEVGETVTTWEVGNLAGWNGSQKNKAHFLVLEDIAKRLMLHERIGGGPLSEHFQGILERTIMLRLEDALPALGLEQVLPSLQLEPPASGIRPISEYPGYFLTLLIEPGITKILIYDKTLELQWETFLKVPTEKTNAWLFAEVAACMVLNNLYNGNLEEKESLDLFYLGHRLKYAAGFVNKDGGTPGLIQIYEERIGGPSAFKKQMEVEVFQMDKEGILRAFGQAKEYIREDLKHRMDVLYKQLSGEKGSTQAKQIMEQMEELDKLYSRT